MIVNQNLSRAFYLGFSRTRLVLFLVLLALVWASLFVSVSGWVLGATGLLVLAWSVQVWLCHVSASSPYAVRALYPGKRDWRIQLNDGRRFSAALSAGSFIDSSVVIVEFIPVSGTRLQKWLGRRRLLCFPDQFGADEWYEFLLYCSVRTRLPAQ